MQKKILIVEAEESLLKLERILLTTKGYLVRGATTGIAALEAVINLHHVQILVLSYHS